MHKETYDGFRQRLPLVNQNDDFLSRTIHDDNEEMPFINE